MPDRSGLDPKENCRSATRLRPRWDGRALRRDTRIRPRPNRPVRRTYWQGQASSTDFPERVRARGGNAKSPAANLRFQNRAADNGPAGTNDRRWRVPDSRRVANPADPSSWPSTSRARACRLPNRKLPRSGRPPALRASARRDWLGATALAATLHRIAATAQRFQPEAAARPGATFRTLPPVSSERCDSFGWRISSRRLPTVQNHPASAVFGSSPALLRPPRPTARKGLRSSTPPCVINLKTHHGHPVKAPAFGTARGKFLPHAPSLPKEFAENDQSLFFPALYFVSMPTPMA